jgi:hypothetical protein
MSPRYLLALLLVGCAGPAPLGNVNDVTDGDDDTDDDDDDDDTDDPPPLAADDPLHPQNLGSTITTLSTGACADRSPGGAGDLASANYVAQRLAAAHMQVRRQPFTDSRGRATENVYGMLVSTGGSDDVIIVGAHRDHLPTNGTLVYPGANDNASGTAALLAIADRLAAAPAMKRTVLFVSFGSEEDPLVEGSTYFVDHADAFSIDDVVFMVNLDSIGSYAAEEVVYALGATTSDTAFDILDERGGDDFPLELDLWSASDDSDHVPFCLRGIPYVAFYTPDPECNRQPCDIAERIDGDSASQIGLLAQALIGDLADTGTNLRAERIVDGCVD